MIATAYFYSTVTKEKEETLEFSFENWNSNFRKHHLEPLRAVIYFCYNVLLFSPTLGFTIMIYSPIFLIERLAEFWKLYEIHERNF